jgi:predicted RNA methylase
MADQYAFLDSYEGETDDPFGFLDTYEEPPKPSLASDVGRLALQGVSNVGGVVGYGLEKTGIAPEFGRQLQESDTANTQRLQKNLSPEQQAANAQPFVNPNYKPDTSEGSSYINPDFGIRSIIGNVVPSIPGTLAMGVFGSPLATAATKGLQVAGVSAKAAQTVGSGVGFGASEGAFSGAQNAAQWGAEERAKPVEVFANSPEFQKSLAEFGDPEKAKEDVINKGQSEIFNETLVKTGGISALTGGGAFGVLKGAKPTDSVINATLKGIGTEAGQEAPQSYYEQIATNKATQKYVDPTQDINEGAINAAAIGGISGGVLGVVGGAGPLTKAAGVYFNERKTDDNIPDTGQPISIASDQPKGGAALGELETGQPGVDQAITGKQQVDEPTDTALKPTDTGVNSDRGRADSGLVPDGSQAGERNIEPVGEAIDSSGIPIVPEPGKPIAGTDEGVDQGIKSAAIQRRIDALNQVDYQGNLIIQDDAARKAIDNNIKVLSALKSDDPEKISQAILNAVKREQKRNIVLPEYTNADKIEANDDLRRRDQERAGEGQSIPKVDNDISSSTGYILPTEQNGYKNIPGNVNPVKSVDILPGQRQDLADNIKADEDLRRKILGVTEENRERDNKNNQEVEQGEQGVPGTDESIGRAPGTGSERDLSQPTGLTDEKQDTKTDEEARQRKESLLSEKFDSLSSDGFPLRKIEGNNYVDHLGEEVRDDYARPAKPEEIKQSIESLKENLQQKELSGKVAEDSLKEGLPVERSLLDRGTEPEKKSSALPITEPGTIQDDLIPEDAKPLVDRARKLNLTRDQFVASFDAGLKDKNLTRRDTVRNIDKYIRETLNTNPEDFYDNYVTQKPASTNQAQPETQEPNLIAPGAIAPSESAQEKPVREAFKLKSGRDTFGQKEAAALIKSKGLTDYIQTEPDENGKVQLLQPEITYEQSNTDTGFRNGPTTVRHNNPVIIAETRRTARVDNILPRTDNLGEETAKISPIQSTGDERVGAAIPRTDNAIGKDEKPIDSVYIGEQKEPIKATPKQITAASKLRNIAESMQGKSQAEQARDRLTNTPKRAREAAGSINNALNQEALAKTMMNIADAHERGETKALAQITNRAQIETLDNLVSRAKYTADRKNNVSYADQQKQQGRPITEDDIKHVEYPEASIHQDNYAKLIGKLNSVRGGKTIAKGIGNSITHEQYSQIKKVLTDAESTVGRFPVERLKEQTRLKLMGINNQQELENAAKEYIQYKQGKREEDQVTKLERELVGKNVGVDYFPTPKPLAQRMAELAGIKAGSRVLEPSAGNGNLADAAKTAGAKVDTVELSSTLRDVLKAKGHNVVANDFNDYTPTEQYDSVIMNPPFSKNQDSDHIQKAFNMVKPGGKLVAIAGEGVFFRNDKKSQAFRVWLDQTGATVEKLPQGTFQDKTLQNITGVNARLVTITKAQEPQIEQASKTETENEKETPTAERDLTEPSTKDILDQKFNISGKYPKQGIGFRRGINSIITDGQYLGKNVTKQVRNDAEYLSKSLLDGNIDGIKLIRDKYYNEWNKSRSQAGTQRDRFVAIDTSKVELHTKADAAITYLNRKTKATQDGLNENKSTIPTEQISEQTKENEIKYNNYLLDLERRAAKFGRTKVEESAKNSMIGLTLGRNFGETGEEHFQRRPDIKLKFDAYKAWLSGEKGNETTIPTEKVSQLTEKPIQQEVAPLANKTKIQGTGVPTFDTENTTGKVTSESGLGENTEDLPILSQTKKQYLVNQKHNYLKEHKNATKQVKAEAFKSFEDNYESELDKAHASIPFEQYKALPGNKGLSDDMLRASHEQLRNEYKKQGAGQSLNNIIKSVDASFQDKAIARSWDGISHQGDAHAKSEKEDLIKTIKELHDEALPLAETPEQKTALYDALTKFNNDYLTKTTNVARVRKGTYSSNIAGRSNFNAKQANARGSSYDKANREFDKWYESVKGSVKQAVLDARNQEQLNTEKAAQQAEIDKKEESLVEHITKLVNFKPGDKTKFGSYFIKSVTRDKQGYPSSVIVDATDLIDNKFDLAKTLFKGSKEKLRETVDKIRTEQKTPDDVSKKSGKLSAAKTLRNIHDSDDLLSTISKLGGLNQDEAVRQGIDPASLGKLGSRILRVFNKKNAKTYDDMSGLLQGHNFDITDANDLVDKVSRAINQNEKIYNPVGYENFAELKTQEKLNDEEAQFAYELENLLSLSKQIDDDYHQTITKLIEGGKITPSNINEFEDEINDIISGSDQQGIKYSIKETKAYQQADIFGGKTEDEQRIEDRKRDLEAKRNGLKTKDNGGGELFQDYPELYGQEKLSQSKEKTGTTKEQLISWLDAKDKKLFDSGKLNIAQNISEVPKGLVSIKTNEIEGFYDQKTKSVWAIADNITQDTLRSVLNHEYLHAAIAENPKLKDRLMNAQADLRTIFDQIESGKYTGPYKETYNAALKRVDRAKTSPQDRFEEWLAYQVSEWSKSPTSLPQRLARAIQTLVATIKAAIFRYTGYISKITPADLSALARSSLNLSEIPNSSDVLIKASKLGYKGSGTGEAEEWLRAKAKGLDMSDKARMERAKAMGFNTKTVFYHGTDADIKAFDLSRQGENTLNSGWYGKGISVTGIKSEANLYGDKEGGIIYPVLIKKMRSFIINDSFLPSVSGETLRKLEKLKGWSDDEKNILDFNIRNRMSVSSSFGKSEEISGQRLTEILINNGYNSVTVNNQINYGKTKKNEEIVLFNPNQIRSIHAAFDPDYADSSNILASQKSNDIRYSIRDTLQESVSPQKRDTAIYYLQNKFIDMNRQMEKVVKDGGFIQEKENPIIAEELYHKRVAQRIEDFRNDEFSPVLQGLHDDNLDMADFQKYLQAKHAPSRNKVMAERNPNQAMIDTKVAQYEADVQSAQTPEDKAAAEKLVKMWERVKPFEGTEEERNSLFGMSNKEAEEFVANKKDKYEPLAKKVYDITKKTLQLQVEYGLEKQETIDALNDQWDFYVPGYRDEAHPDEHMPIGQGFNVRGSSFKSAVGSNAEVTNILAHIHEQREQALIRGEKNEIHKRLYELMKNHPDPDFAKPGKVPVQKKLIDGIVQKVVSLRYQNQPNIVLFRSNGKNVSIEFNERNQNAVRLAGALKNLDGADLDMVENIIAKGTRWLAAVNTQYNIVFGAFNLMRDASGGILNLTTTQIANKKTDVLKAIPEAIKVIYKIERGFQDNSPLAKRFREFKLAGATTGFRDMFTDIKERQDYIERELKKSERNRLLKAGDYVLKWLSDYNTVMENSVRLAAYHVARESGLSQDVSGSIAKNLTVNFNRKGAATTKIGAFYAFFNASAQGTARMYETLRGPAGKQIMAGGVALGATVALIGIGSMGPDDWEKIPEYIRERNFIIPDPLNKGNYIAIPYPLGFHILPNIGRKVIEAAFGSNRVSPTARFGTLIEEMIDAFNPLGGKDIGQTITPTVADPVVALWRNRDWTGKTIYREDFSQLDPTPGFTRTKDTATKGSKLASETINKLTGGTNYKPGMFSPTPDQIDYVLGQLLGGTGREIGNLQQAIASVGSGEELPQRKVPLLGRIYGETKGNYAERDLFYQNIKLLNQHHNELDGLKKEPLGLKKVAEYLKENKEAKYYDRMKTTKKQVDKLWKKKRLVENPKMSRVIDDQIGREMKKFNDLVVDSMQ